MEEAENKAKKDAEFSKLNFDQVKKQRDDYFEKLRTWLKNARLWQNVSSGFPYYFAGISIDGTSNLYQSQNAYASFSQNNVNNTVRQRNVPQQNQFNRANNGDIPFYQTYPFTLPPNFVRPPSTYEFVIPPLWKRLVAELIDFALLFTVKLALTFLLMESFNFINIDLYGFESFQKNLENPEVAYPMALELLTLEMLHRVVVCAYETYFLRGQLCATPGKRYMGLMVVTVATLTLVPGRQVETVSVTGAKPLGWRKSLLRSLVKNLLVGLLLPLCLTFYIFPHNRTSYDMTANTLVVETHPEFLMYQSLT